MALAGAAGTQLAQVIVALDERHHTLDKVEALFLGKLAGFVASRAQQHIEPLVARKVLALVDHGIQVQIGHLDGRERRHAKRRVLGSALFALGLGAARRIVAKDLHAKLVFLIDGMTVLDAHNAPNATLQNLGIVAHVLGRHYKRLNSQIGKRRHVDIFVLVELGRHLVDDGKTTQLANLGLNALGLIGAHVVIGEDPADALQTLCHGILVVGRAVHAQQILQYKGGHVGAALHKGRQVFAHDLASKVLEQLAVQPIHVVAVVLGGLVHGLVIAIGRGFVLGGRRNLIGYRGHRRLRGRRGSHGLCGSLSLRGEHGLLCRHRNLHRRIHINRGNFPQIVVIAIKHRAHS